MNIWRAIHLLFIDLLFSNNYYLQQKETITQLKFTHQHYTANLQYSCYNEWGIEINNFFFITINWKREIINRIIKVRKSRD